MIEEKYYENHDFSDLIIEKNLEMQEFKKCSFQSSDFTEISTIHKCKFNECNFSSSALNGIDIENSSFLNCNFNHANFFATTFDDCKMMGSSFLYTDTSLLHIIRGDWSYTELRYLEFDKQKLYQVSFFGADLSGSKFTRCVLDECDFSQTIVQGLSFFKSDIRGSSLNEVDVLAIDIKEATIDLEQCVLIATATGAKYKP